MMLVFGTLQISAMNGSSFCITLHGHCESYDSSHYETITRHVSRLKEESIIADEDHICQKEVLTALVSLKTGNMCGNDRVCNEHLIHGGLMLKH